MSNIQVKDGPGNSKYLKATGAGTAGDPHIPQHTMVDEAGNAVFYKGSALAAAAVSVGTTATPLPASALANRRSMMIYNNGAAIIYLGGSGVTTATGFPLLPGQAVTLEVGTLAVYGRVLTGTVEARILEVA